MRQLNKTIFINSATVRYEEIHLDGNVHFTGTQGVGKSTLLRAVLFFYNADTTKLGIPKGKKSFSEYYFDQANSYIIHEVKGDTGPFCILVYKQSGRIAFRFIDSPYVLNHYIHQNIAHESWEKIRITLDQAGIDYSNKIERFEEYRNILYGNTEGKSTYKKYALLESKLFQSIPRTIQNVFLNSKLEADFIKKTIIDSISEDEFQIDLGVYRHHLSDFENEYTDIGTFKNPKVQQRAEKIILHHNHILKAINDKRENLRLLERVAAVSEKKLPGLEKKIALINESISKEQTKLRQLEIRHNELIAELNAEKGQLSGKKKEAEQKQKYYKEINITGILEKVAKKGDHLNRKSALEKEKNVILAEFRSIEEKYSVLFDQLKNEYNGKLNLLENTRVELKTQCNLDTERINSEYEEIENEIRSQYKSKLKIAKETVDEAQNKYVELEKKEIELKAKKFYEHEINLIGKTISDNEKIIIEDAAKVTVAESEKARLQQELSHEKSQIENRYKQESEKTNGIISQKALELKKLTENIEISNSAFFGYLNEKYPGWENTIGKVCREDVIFNASLEPQMTAVNELLFGVKLNLEGLEVKTKTLEAYAREKKELENEVEKIKKSLADLAVSRDEDLDKATKRIQVKTRIQNDLKQQLEFKVQGLKSQNEQLRIDLVEYSKKATVEKEKALKDVNSQVTNAREVLVVAKEEYAQTERGQEEQINLKKGERNLKIDEIRSILNKNLKHTEEEYKNINSEQEKRKTELQSSKLKELEGKGLNTDRLGKIEEAIIQVNSELNFIENNAEVALKYKIDKKEYIDKLELITANLSLKEEEILQANSKFLTEKSTLSETIHALNKELKDIEAEHEEIAAQLKLYNDFKLSKEYEPSEVMSGNDAVMLQPISYYIAATREAHYSYVEEMTNLTTVTNDYIGRFNQNNIFSFKAISTPEGYLNFAILLKEFIDENKITEFEKRVNKRYSDIINIVSKDMTDLVSKEGQIQGIISKINRDFKEKNFVGVISLIEMKAEESASRVVDVLKRIKSFNAENEFGEFSGNGPNLFSTSDDEKKIIKAVELLTYLVKEIKESKHSTIAISDSFELRFRVIENQNDSGWVESLSNVGSEGTDVLVKAMINIMLLNVFKEGASRKFKDFRLHCMMDEIGRLHPGNVRGILKFANDRNIVLINGSPIERDALAYRHVYELRKDQNKNTRVKRLITSKNEALSGHS